MASVNVSLSLSPLTLFFHFTLFTASYPISSLSQALELVTDTVPASPLPNVPSFCLLSSKLALCLLPAGDMLGAWPSASS